MHFEKKNVVKSFDLVKNAAGWQGFSLIFEEPSILARMNCVFQNNASGDGTPETFVLMALK